MPNDFSSIKNNGLLKDSYTDDEESTPLQEALKRKRQKMLQSIKAKTGSVDEK